MRLSKTSTSSKMTTIWKPELMTKREDDTDTGPDAGMARPTGEVGSEGGTSEKNCAR